jgi:ABC-type glycerol-3-phosphate transport system permease component
MSTTRRNPKLLAWWRRRGRFLAAHLLLIAFALTTLLPFLWMVFASFKPQDEIEQLNPLPTAWRPENYADVLTHEHISFGRYYFNSLFVASWVTFLTCLTSSLAAYAFSRISWRGRDHVFKLYLATMMVPGVVTMIPNYTLMVKLLLLDSHLGLILPASFSAFGTFLLRQFMLGIPPALDEAARMDGASHWRVYLDVILPLARPGLIVLAIFTFMGNYGSFFWPLVLIQSEHLRTLPIGMLYFDTLYGRQTSLLMAASVMNIVPLIALFAVLQRYLVRGIQMGAVKG